MRSPDRHILRWSRWLIVAVVIVGLAASLGILGQSAHPNVVILVSDDQGWGDVGYTGGDIPTPNIDRLASEGVRLDRYYSYPTCSMTRAALLTGISTIRTGVNNGRGLSKDFYTLPQIFKNAGYQTWMFGKWHLGGPEDNTLSGSEYCPQARGFDYFYGHLHGGIDYFRHIRRDLNQPDWQRNGKQVSEEGYSTFLLAEDAIVRILSRDKTKPFLLYLAFNAVHGPAMAPEDLISKYRGKYGGDRRREIFAAMVDALDQSIGKLVETIDQEGLREETLILFFSDNGGQLSTGASNGLQRGEKGTVLEGGIHVPAVMTWKGQLPEGVISRQPIWVVDFLPTLVSAVGLEFRPTQVLDGLDLFTALKENRLLARDTFVIGTHGYAAIDEPWKLVRSRYLDEILLFNIETDPNERNNLAEQYPDKVKEMLARIDAAIARGPRREDDQRRRADRDRASGSRPPSQRFTGWGSEIDRNQLVRGGGRNRGGNRGERNRQRRP